MNQQTKLGIRAAALASCAAVAFTLAGCGGGGDGNGGSSSAPANPGSATTTTTTTTTPASGDNGSAATSPASSGDGTTTPASGNNAACTTMSASTRSAVEGMWQHDEEQGFGVGRAIILDDGTLWANTADLEPTSNGADPNLGYSIFQVVHGSVCASGNNFTGTDLYVKFGSAPGNQSFSGTATAKSTLTVTSSPTGDSSSTATSSDNYYSYNPVYDQAVPLTSLAGNYASTYTGLSNIYTSNYQYNGSGPLTITANGVLTLSIDTTCTVSGTITQHNTPRGPVGVFDINLTFGDACPPHSGTTATGIAYLTDGGAFLEAMSFTADNTNALIFRAHRAQ